MNARATAMKRSTRIGLRFEPTANDCQIGEYVDGNGVRASDIGFGLDLEIAQSRSVPAAGFSRARSWPIGRLRFRRWCCDAPCGLSMPKR